MIDSIRVSNDHPAPYGRKSFLATLSAPLPDPSGVRLFFVRPRSGEDLLSNPRRVLRRMEVGDNAFFPVSRADAVGFRSRLSSAARLQGIELTTQLSTQYDIEGLRVWRLR